MTSYQFDSRDDPVYQAIRDQVARGVPLGNEGLSYDSCRRTSRGFEVLSPDGVRNLMETMTLYGGKLNQE